MFCPLSVFRCKANGYLIFFTHRHSDLYNAYHRLLLEPLSRLLYPQFQSFLNLVLILKSTKKTKKKSVNHMLYRFNILEEKSCIISLCRIKVVIIKDCHSSISDFDFIRINNICYPKINKKMKLGHLEEPLFQVMNIL